MKRTKKSAFRRQLLLSLTLIVSLLVVNVSASYSWFLYYQKNETYEIAVEVMDTFNLTL